jgi:hypothetical protein
MKPCIDRHILKHYIWGVISMIIAFPLVLIKITDNVEEQRIYYTVKPNWYSPIRWIILAFSIIIIAILHGIIEAYEEARDIFKCNLLTGTFSYYNKTVKTKVHKTMITYKFYLKHENMSKKNMLILLVVYVICITASILILL